jgi:hypothetical protein
LPSQIQSSQSNIRQQMHGLVCSKCRFQRYTCALRLGPFRRMQLSYADMLHRDHSLGAFLIVCPNVFLGYLKIKSLREKLSANRKQGGSRSTNCHFVAETANLEMTLESQLGKTKGVARLEAGRCRRWGRGADLPLPHRLAAGWPHTDEAMRRQEMVTSWLPA